MTRAPHGQQPAQTLQIRPAAIERKRAVALIPQGWRLEGSFGGVDPVVIIVMVGATIGAILMTTIIARQLAQLQPKAPVPSQVQKASGEFDAWTERPRSQEQKDQEYYSLYGSQPGRASVSPSRPMAAPPAPSSVAPMGQVMIDLSGKIPAAEGGWISDSPPANAGWDAPPMHPPAQPKPTGPTDEVIAPSHGRRVRDTSTGELPPREGGSLLFDRSSVEGGAVAPAAPPARSTATRSTPPPPLPTAPPSPPRPSPLKTAELADALPEGITTTAPARAAFRGPSRGQSVVGAGQTGVQEGATLSAATKSIRCPKCQTVFVGPAARPATVKCPACGTTGTLK